MELLELRARREAFLQRQACAPSLALQHGEPPPLEQQQVGAPSLSPQHGEPPALPSASLVTSISASVASPNGLKVTPSSSDVYPNGGIPWALDSYTLLQT